MKNDTCRESESSDQLVFHSDKLVAGDRPAVPSHKGGAGFESRRGHERVVDRTASDPGFRCAIEEVAVTVRRQYEQWGRKLLGQESSNDFRLRAMGRRETSQHRIGFKSRMR